MRRFEFRGKRISDNTWCEGEYPCKETYLGEYTGYSLLNKEDYNSTQETVHSNTIGQLALYINRDLRIFEHDIVKITFHDGASFEESAFEPGGFFIGKIKYLAGCFFVFHKDGTYIPLYAIVDVDGSQIEILGNIFDNPELLE